MIDLFHKIFTNFDFLWAGVACVFLGMSKAGIKGIGVLVVLLMAYVFESKPSTGVLIPLMILADVMAVYYYHRHARWMYLLKLLPAMCVGVLLGVWFGQSISEVLFKQLMAGFILLTILIMFGLDQAKKRNIPNNVFFSSGMGLLSGFTSMIGNLAGSFANIYFLAMRLPKNEFIGTAAWLFFIINVFKLPFHIFSWKTVTKDSLQIDLFLIPFVFLGFYLGIKVVEKINNEFYRKFILIVTGLGAIFILFK
ncbi:sulfite exporter TauE/SafE family protein [Namhaeicola litoreus]|uniref:Probable membrane transporter protein n=1 Tax=Namhaeicola litoreus TaxID=1052145 RepID=A0ABW3Y314_9FLAO